MEMHTPYAKKLNRLPDFVVEYQIDLADEIKNATPYQGMRVDFAYGEDCPYTDGVHMIWPEIIDSDGYILRDTSPWGVTHTGYAYMWIVNEASRAYHHNRLKLGMQGLWWRGGRIAFVKVVQINEL